MSDDTRFIAVSREQAELLEHLGEQLLRIDHPGGVKLLAMFLDWQQASEVRVIKYDLGTNMTHSVRVDADAQPRDVPARTLRVLEGGA